MFILLRITYRDILLKASPACLATHIGHFEAIVVLISFELWTQLRWVFAHTHLVSEFALPLEVVRAHLVLGGFEHFDAFVVTEHGCGRLDGL
jgi:hypothetical protein